MQARMNFSIGRSSAIYAIVICFSIALAVDMASGDNDGRHLGHRNVTSVLVAGGFGTENQFGQRTVTNTAEVYDSSLATFSTTSNMSSPREFHSATVLPSGLVFVAGGVNDRFIGLASTELYDSASGAFSTGGDMTSSRAAHTATLLRDGTVLLAGGNSFTNGAFNPLSSAEIYDPSTGTFTATGSMSAARQGHSATLLKNGLLLIVGGQNNSGRLATAELYDPSSHSFTPTGSLITARDSQTANLLVDGTVLIAGGVDNNGVPLANVELYDPVAGTFASTGSMVGARVHHISATLPD